MNTPTETPTARLKVFTLCSKCNKESEVPMGRNLLGYCSNNHSCPHCDHTIQTWLKIPPHEAESKLTAVTKERNEAQRLRTEALNKMLEVEASEIRLQEQLAEAKQDLTAALIDVERVVRERDEALEENQLILERDEAEDAISEAYSAVFGCLPEWTNYYGFEDAVKDIESEIHNRKAELAEANADRARLREALGDIQTLAYDDKPLSWRAVTDITEAALSTPPPPVVPNPETEKLIQGVEHLHAVCAGFTPQPHPEIDQAWAEFQEALATYRVKHPLPQP